MNIKSNNKSVNIRLNNVVLNHENHSISNDMSNQYEEIDYETPFYEDNIATMVKKMKENLYPKSVFNYNTRSGDKIFYKLPDGIVSNSKENLDKLYDESVYKKYKDLYKENANTYTDFVTMLTNKMTQFNLIDDYVPQGVCSVDNNTIISCYDHTEENKNNSMLMFIDSLGNKKELYLADENGNKITSHVGGIAYDDINNLLWVTGSSGKIYSFNYDDILDSYSTSYITPNNCISLDIKNENGNKVASYMTYFEGKLYVGSFNENETGIVKEYYIENDGSTLSEQSSFSVPKKTQGLSFYKSESNEVYMACACSYGRKNSSSLHIYDLKDGQFTKEKTFKLPPMLEQVTFDKDGLLQCVFESGAEAYNVSGYDDKKEYNIVELQTVVNLDIFNSLG